MVSAYLTYRKHDTFYNDEFSNNSRLKYGIYFIYNKPFPFHRNVLCEIYLIILVFQSLIYNNEIVNSKVTYVQINRHR